MIICAAIKVKFDTGKDVIVPCIRHGFGFQELRDLGLYSLPFAVNFTLEEGFVTSDHKFLDRKEAFIHAKENHQLPPTVLWHKEDNKEDELFSEDLY